jgi:diguanylate cyclase
VDALLRRADVAMYSAKREGSGCAVYAGEMDQHNPLRLTLIGDLRQAITAGDLSLVFQPKLDIATGVVHGAEALARWHHPGHGSVPPSQFIELAEHSGLIKPLTLWVLENAIAQAMHWQARGLNLNVAVNLSAQNLHDPQLVSRLEHVLESRGAGPSTLAVEITETSIMRNPDFAMEIVTRLHELGVWIAIDDFGTGYSSLGYLKRLPVDEIKIDRSFVLDMTRNENDAFIVGAVIDLSHKLGVRVVAEGVENRETLTLLRDLGCDSAQGFYVSKPLPANEVQTWLTANRAGVDICRTG